MDKPKWILNIEDEPYQSKTLNMILEQKGYKVVTATTGEEACSYLDNHAYDLVLLDFHIADMSRLDFLSRIHNCDPEMPILILTGDISQKSSLEAIRRGADEIILKPVSLQELLERISLIFSVSRSSKD